MESWEKKPRVNVILGQPVGLRQRLKQRLKRRQPVKMTGEEFIEMHKKVFIKSNNLEGQENILKEFGFYYTEGYFELGYYYTHSCEGYFRKSKKRHNK